MTWKEPERGPEPRQDTHTGPCTHVRTYVRMHTHTPTHAGIETVTQNGRILILIWEKLPITACCTSLHATACPCISGTDARFKPHSPTIVIRKCNYVINTWFPFLRVKRSLKKKKKQSDRDRKDVGMADFNWYVLSFSSLCCVVVLARAPNPVYIYKRVGDSVTLGQCNSVTQCNNMIEVYTQCSSTTWIYSRNRSKNIELVQNGKRIR